MEITKECEDFETKFTSLEPDANEQKPLLLFISIIFNIFLRVF